MTNARTSKGHDKADSDADRMTPEQLAEAKRYGREDLICDLADKAVDAGYLALAAFVLAWPVDRWLESFSLLRYDTLRLLVLFAIVFALHVCVSFPLTFYSSHLLEHRYKLSNQTAVRWFRQYGKKLALSLVFGAVIWVGLFWIIRVIGPFWWLAATAAFFLVSVVLGQLYPVLVQPLFYKIQRLEDVELGRRVSRLVAGTGLSIDGVFRIDLGEETKKVNAMLAGLGRSRRVLLSDTLLEQFTHDEIEVILSHEIGHHVHRHIWKLLLAGAIYSPIGFWICDRLLALRIGPGTYDPGQLPVYALPTLMLVLFGFSLLITPLQCAVSRHFERQSDRYAIERTGLPSAYRSAFQKMARLNKVDPDPHPIEVLLLHSHPPISERLAMADKR